MPKPNKNIDELFQTSLKQFESEPSLKIWDGIEQELDQIDRNRNKNKKRFLGLRWSAAALIVLALPIVVLHFQPSIQKISLAIIPPTQLKNKEAEHATAVGNKIQIVQPTSSLEQTSHLSIDKSENKAENHFNGTISTIKKSNHSLEQPSIMPIDSLGSEVLFKKLGAFSDLLQVQQTRLKNSLYLEPMAVLAIKQLPIYPAVQQIPQPKAVKPSIKSNSIHRLSLSVFYAPELAYRFELSNFEQYIPIDTNTGTATALAFASFDPEEIPIFATSSSMAVFYDVSKRISIGAGLTYAVKGQKGIFNGVHYTPLFPQDTMTLTYLSHQVSSNDIRIQSSYGTYSSFYTTTDTHAVELKSITQKFRYLELPLMIQCKIIEHNKFNLHATLGTSLGYMLASSAYLTIEDSNGMLQHLSAAPKDELIAWNLGAIVKVGGGYSLSPSLCIEVEPFFKTALSPTYERTYPFSLGLNCGINYHF